MNGQDDRSVPWRLAVTAVAMCTTLLLGGAISSCDDNIGSTPELTTTEQDSPEDTSGLQPSDSFGYIPEHESPLPSAPIGPGAPGPFGNDPFDNPGPPLPGGPGLPAHATVAPTLTSPAG